MRHEDALLVRRLAQNSAPGLAMEPYHLEGESGLLYSDGRERQYSADLPQVLRLLAQAVSRLQPVLFCPGCRQDKPREEFFNYFRGDTARKQRVCKECSKKQRRDLYRKDPEYARRRDKRYRLRGGSYWTVEAAQRSIERQRAQRLAVRVARAELLVGLCAQEYGLAPDALRGRPHLRPDNKRGAAAALAARLIRWSTNLHPAAIAEMLGCTEADVAKRIAAARRWTHSQKGDVRIKDAMAHITQRYVRERAHLEVPKKEYAAFTVAQRLPGRTSRKHAEKHEEESHEEPCA